MIGWRLATACLLAAPVLGATGGAAGDPASSSFKDLSQEVESFRLGNGLRFIVLERHDAPVFTFFTLVNVGAVNEVAGITGLAHMFEHMAFKGTTTLGVTDREVEREAMEEVDRIYAQLLAEERKGWRADSTRLVELRAAFKSAQEEAGRYVVTNRFGEIVEQEGGRGLNAFTSADMTGYFYSLPSNKLELWAILESDRFANPVLREFYKERDVVIEERRRSLESTPWGRLYAEALGVAFLAHPYRDGVIGHRSDLETFTREEARQFYRTYYVANNMVIAVVGDVTVEEVRRLAQRYFAKIPAGPEPPAVDTREPEQKAQRRVILEDDAQPIVSMAYHIPENRHPDWHAYSMLAEILGSGRTSRLYEALVKNEKLASRVSASVGEPGERYPNLLDVTARVAEGRDPAAIEEALEREIRRIVEQGVDPEELDKVRNRAKADFIRRLRSNWGLAFQLAYYEAIHGDWGRMFEELDRMAAVTPEDIQRVAAATFRRSNRTVAILKRPETEAS